MCEICSKLTIKTPEQRSGVFVVNFEQISYIVLVFPLLILYKQILVGLLLVPMLIVLIDFYLPNADYHTYNKE